MPASSGVRAWNRARDSYARSHFRVVAENGSQPVRREARGLAHVRRQRFRVQPEELLTQACSITCRSGHLAVSNFHRKSLIPACDTRQTKSSSTVRDTEVLLKCDGYSARSAAH